MVLIKVYPDPDQSKHRDGVLISATSGICPYIAGGRGNRYKQSNIFQRKDVSCTYIYTCTPDSNDKSERRM